MIIIKTETGDVLLNEKLTLKVEHNKEKAEVTVTYPYNKPRPQTIPFVLRVDYTNDAEPTRYNSNGLEIENMANQLELQKANARESLIILDNVRAGYFDLRSFVEKLLEKKALDTEEKLTAECMLVTIDQRIDNNRPLLEEVREQIRNLREVNQKQQNTEKV